MKYLMKHRGRRLAFERCEDRRMLAGTALVANVSLAPVANEGGFITVSTNGFLRTSANDFSSDAISFNRSFGDFTLFDFGNVISFDQVLGTLDAAGDSSGITHGNIASSIASTTAGPTTGPTTGPLYYDFDLSDSLVLPKTGESVTVNDDINIPVNIPVENILENILDEPAVDTPGLSGGTVKPLVIDEPIQIAAFTLPSVNSMLHEGGALEVAAAVHTTQRAYESQLSAVIASNLNRDGVLPATAPVRAQPVVAELARMVAFETVEQQAVRTGETVQTADDLRIDPAPTTPATLQPVSAQLDSAPALRNSASEATSNDRVIRTTQAFLHDETTSPNLAERIDNEHQAARVTTFAEWPVLATVIAGYLLIERRSPQAAPTVQTPPRRSRQTLAR